MLGVLGEGFAALQRQHSPRDSTAPRQMDEHRAAVLGRITKPANDTLDYRIIVLENGLKALLVHDPDTDKAAAAMDVRTAPPPYTL